MNKLRAIALHYARHWHEGAALAVALYLAHHIF